jgi:hypothetical protein
MSFRITGLPSEQFTHLFALSDEELALQGAVRRIADSRTPGYPCRVSLTDSREGDELLLVNYEHHPVHSPYRMRFAIYVRKGETRPVEAWQFRAGVRGLTRYVFWQKRGPGGGDARGEALIDPGDLLGRFRGRFQ